MKIAVNLLYLVSDTKNGVGKHVEDILTGMEKLNVLDKFYLIIQKTFYDHYLCLRQANRSLEDVNFIICREGRLFRRVAEKLGRWESFARAIYLNFFVMPSLLKTNDLDLMFNPFNEATNNISLKYPIVTVVHDLFYKNFPKRKKYLPSRLYALYVHNKHKAMLKKAKKVVAISEFVKSDIIKHFPAVSKNNIVVIPNAVILPEETSVPAGIKKPFLLYVSEHGIHKNHLTLLKAYNIVKNKIPHRLVLLGKQREETSNIKKYIQENTLGEKIDLMSNVSDAERNWLYKNADLFISPSLHEGFGRTPVEAAIAGCMVLTSRETSPSTDENALAAKILELLQNPIPEKKREEIAMMFREIYDPVRVAGMYYDLFQEVVLQKNKDRII